MWPVRRGVHALDAQLLTVCPHTDDDGESETRVEARLITPLDGGGSDSDRRSDRLREGDKIEADYRGRGKFYPGKISRDRGDDTYDIDYDDGERETRVSKRLIRSKDGGSGFGCSRPSCESSAWRRASHARRRHSLCRTSHPHDPY